MARVRRTAYVMSAVFCLSGVARGQPAAPVELRVVTYNAWDMPAGMSRANGPRIERIGPALVALRPDVVCFQELWIDADAARVGRDLAAAGLTHERRFKSGLAGSGLHVFSRLPIREASFVRYAVGGQPWKLWHCDYYGGKGIARVRLDTPLGPLDVADTHMHAVYGDEAEYLATRTAEALEAAAFLEERDGAPLVLAGDLNAWEGSLPFALLVHGARFTTLVPEKRIDWIIARPGATVSARIASFEHALAGPVDLGDGRSMPLSDHEARLAVVTLEPKERGGPLRGAGPDPRAAEARSVLEAELAASVRRTALQVASGAVLLALSALLVRRKRPERAWLRRPLVAALVAAALLLASAALLFEPGERAGLGAALERLGR